MANNRLHIVNSLTGEEFLIAKSAGYGWDIPEVDSLGHRLQEFFNNNLYSPTIDKASVGNGDYQTCYKLQDDNYISDERKEVEDDT